MNQPTAQIIVETLAHYNQKDAAEIGVLLSHLSDRFDGSAVPEELLSSIITSPSHDQLVARSESGTIVGTATVSIILGAGSSRNAWLEDFIVSPDAQGMGVGSAIWDAIMDWCRVSGARNLNFTSRPSRTAAQQFYLKRGAVIRETNSFIKDTSKSS